MPTDAESEDLRQYLSEITLLRDSLSNTSDNDEMILELSEQAKSVRNRIDGRPLSDPLENEAKRRKIQEEDAAFARQLLGELGRTEEEERRLEQIRQDEEFARWLLDEENGSLSGQSLSVPTVQSTLGAELSLMRPCQLSASKISKEMSMSPGSKNRYHSPVEPTLLFDDKSSDSMVNPEASRVPSIYSLESSYSPRQRNESTAPHRINPQHSSNIIDLSSSSTVNLEEPSWMSDAIHLLNNGQGNPFDMGYSPWSRNPYPQQGPRIKRELPWITDNSKNTLGSSPNHPISLDDSSDDDTSPLFAQQSPSFHGMSAMAQSYYNMYSSMYDRQDSSQTKEDLKNLLMNIRPDQELPAHLREGTPAGLSDRIALMEHQKLGLTWLKKMEQGSNRGGILADDMGLGKTVQSLALIVSRKSDDLSSKTNLIVTPVALLHQWAREIKTKTSPQLKVYIHHSNHRRHFKAKELLGYDVVLTTFHTLAYEYKAIEKHNKLREENPELPERPPIPCPFTDAKWYRVILDEAQMIKNHNTQSAKACHTLKAKYRWCLSGTPMQNGVDELFSLIKFLRIRPYNNLSEFNSNFSRPLKSGRQQYISKAMKKLQALLKAVLLRRTKESEIDGRPILTLPPKTIEQVHAVFSPDEQDFYSRLESRSLIQMNRYVQAGTVGRNYSNILVLLLRLRQACCHPHLIKNIEVPSSAIESTKNQQAEIIAHLASDVVERIKSLESFDCSICFDSADNPSCLECGHYYCAECLLSVVVQAQAINIEAGQESSHGKCPQCRGRLDMNRVFSLKEFYKTHAPERLKSETEKDKILADPKGKGKAMESSNKLDGSLGSRQYVPSAKVEKTMDILRATRKKNHRTKTLIFSQFTTLLDILEYPLREAGIKFGRYDGSLSANARNEAIVSFQDNPNITVLLVSLKAGNVGLNLTAATEVIIFDPYWNPSTENQAIDRTHRIGQNLPVTVHKLVIKGTVEDRVLALQEKKRELIEGALSDDATKAIARLTQRDLLFLFGLE
ncbi:putative ATP-dependent helicase [Neolecta irregularis DAH-3]|uniref:Putative ATP-dependent helicase n=1 Tax=Neolecta irregularis (strain DAH-3) TaxID=1198029 RepID=A0A1U7LQD5_NEOID|nr:putative ATP-dependent helicase [Neolecta irregularis DAH-3]|eukprot:OLL24867.1 putative ATP-dependent helicase [Neolecta irregularis DAH-3]